MRKEKKKRNNNGDDSYRFWGFRLKWAATFCEGLLVTRGHPSLSYSNSTQESQYCAAETAWEWQTTHWSLTVGWLHSSQIRTIVCSKLWESHKIQRPSQFAQTWPSSRPGRLRHIKMFGWWRAMWGMIEYGERRRGLFIFEAKWVDSYWKGLKGVSERV